MQLLKVTITRVEESNRYHYYCNSCRYIMHEIQVPVLVLEYSSSSEHLKSGTSVRPYFGEQMHEIFEATVYSRHTSP